MFMPNRTFAAPGTGQYRFGFSGKETDNEPYGPGGLSDDGMRMALPNTGRFMQVDPIAAQYPELSTYQFASNTPVWAVDLDGLEAAFVQFGIRGSIPLLIGLGPTSAGSIGVAVDLQGNIGAYVQASFGGQVGIGLASGLSGGVNFDADNIYDLSGWGINFGTFFGEFTPFEFSGEVNLAVEGQSSNFGELLSDENTIYNKGVNVGLPIPGTGATAGLSIYGEVSYTWFLTPPINLSDSSEPSGNPFLTPLFNFTSSLPNIIRSNPGLQNIKFSQNDIDQLQDGLIDQLHELGLMKPIELPEIEVTASRNDTNKPNNNNGN